MKKDLQQLFNDYMNECRYSACLRPETIRGYKNVFILFLKIMPEVTTTESLTTEMLNLFFQRIQTRTRVVGRDTLKTGVRKSTIKTQWSKLNVFFKWLCEKSYLEKNPLKNIKPPRVSYDDFKRLEDNEIHKIYTAISLHSFNFLLLRRDTFMISALLYCGLRKGELISLKVEDIDMEKKEITIKGETSKSKKTRTLVIHPTLLMHLKDYLRERNIRGLKTEHLIVSNRGDGGLGYEGLGHWVESLIERSGVKFHLHQFRHTFGCKLAEKNINAFKIQKMMGHTDIKMTMKYVRSLKTEDMGEDISKISI